MRSILAKVLLWSLGTFALSLVAFWAIKLALEPHGPPQGDPFWSMVALVEDDACRAFEEGGSERLADHLRRLDARLPGEHFLTDPRGLDLASGADRSALLAARKAQSGPPRLPDGRMVLVGRPRGGRYRFITVVRPWFGPPDILPYYGAVVLVIVLMGAILAAHLAAPLRRLRGVMERFGRGDLAARAHSRRRDEIGSLARAFDEMAGRIETLLEAERRLLQDVSHELRSPLARLGFAVELARTGGDREAALARVRREADRMADLIGELLELTRIEGDPAAVDVEPIDLADLLGRIAADCDLEAAAKRCRLALRADRPASLAGRPELLRRAVENVVRNAIRHAPEGTAIELAVDPGAERIAVVVRDRGPGVPEEFLAEIFRPFFRVEPDRSRASGGVGLGLAIARRAVALHGGRIAARNASPGLVVTIEFPRADADAHPVGTT